MRRRPCSSCCSPADASLRAVLFATAVIALPPMAPARADAWRPGVDAARAYAQRRQGEVSFAVRTPSRAWRWRRLRSVVPRQRWGIGTLALPGWRVYFKGGWAAGSGAVEHQVALLRRGSRRVAVAVLVTASPSHAYAKRTLRGVFARLLRVLPAAQ